jgi:hypothetical protein
MPLQIVQIVYWLALATWFGGAMFIAIAWRSIFKTVEEAKPILPDVLSVNLEGQHGTLLAGTIVGNILAVYLRLELGCCAAILLALIGETALSNLHDMAVIASLVMRGVLLIASGGVVIYDWKAVWPVLWRHRQEFIDHADEPELANPAKDQFDRLQRKSVQLLELLVFLLLGMLLFSVPSGLHWHPAASPEVSHGDSGK